MALRTACRTITFALGLLLTPSAVQAQQAEKTIGFLSLGRGVPPQVFVQELAKHGYVEGKNITIEYPLADGHHDLMSSLAADLVHRKVDAILAMGDQAVVPAMAQTKTIPIVMVSCD